MPAITSRTSGHDHDQAPHRALLVLELAAVGDEVALRQRDTSRRDFALHVGSEAPEVPAPDIALHDDEALTVFVIDEFGAFDDPDRRDLRQTRA